LVDRSREAVSQLLRISCSAAPVERSDVRLSSRKAACSSVAPQSSTGNPDSVYTSCETALAVRARNAAKRSSQELLCCVTFIRVISVCPSFQGCKGREVHHPKRRTAQVAVTVTFRLEDVEKLISLSFRDFIFDPKCLPTSQRSLIRHPRAIFFYAEFSANFEIDFFTSSCPRVFPPDTMSSIG
jgi:hypothetical protein